MSTAVLRRVTIGLALAALALILAAPTAQAAPPKPEEDPFYEYAGSTPLAEVAPGTVLKTRTLSYHVAGLPLPVRAVQLLYRSTSELGEPTVNVTSVLKPAITIGAPQVVAYQSFYDSLNPADEPSYAISGGLTLGGAIPQVESALIGARAAGRTDRRRRRHRGGAGRLRRRPRVRDEHARQPARRARLARHRPRADAEDRPGRLLGRRDRHRVGGRAGAQLRAGSERQAGRGGDGRRPGRPGPQPPLRRRQPQLGGRDADGDRRRLARLPHRPHPVHERIRQGTRGEARKGLDRRSARPLPGPHLGAAGEARIPDAGEHPRLRRTR